MSRVESRVKVSPRRRGKGGPPLAGILSRYRREGMSPGRIAEVVADAQATKLRVDVLSIPRPPRVALPPPRVRGLTDRVANGLCDALARGATLGLAADFLSIDPRRLAAWLRGEGEPHDALREAVRASVAWHEVDVINSVNLGRHFDPNAAARWLAMRYPKKYVSPEGPAITFDLGAVLTEALTERRLAKPQPAALAAPAPVVDAPGAPAVPAQVARALDQLEDDRRELL